jgi:hypothetical protein
MLVDPKKVTVPLAVVGAVVVGAFSLYFWAVNHFAIAAEVKQQVQRLDGQVDELREKQLLDQTFEIEFIPENRRTDFQRAQLERIKAELERLRKLYFW